MGHIELLEFYGLRLMVLLTLRDFDGIYQNHRSPYEGLGVRWFIWLIIPTKEDESNNTRLSLNFFVELHNIFKDKVKNGKRLRDKILYYTIYVQLHVDKKFYTMKYVFPTLTFRKVATQRNALLYLTRAMPNFPWTILYGFYSSSPCSGGCFWTTACITRGPTTPRTPSTGIPFIQITLY